MDDGQMLKVRAESLNKARTILVEAQSVIQSLEHNTSPQEWATKKRKLYSLLRKANKLTTKARRLGDKYERSVQSNLRSIS